MLFFVESCSRCSSSGRHGQLHPRNGQLGFLWYLYSTSFLGTALIDLVFPDLSRQRKHHIVRAWIVCVCCLANMGCSLVIWHMHLFCYEFGTYGGFIDPKWSSWFYILDNLARVPISVCISVPHEMSYAKITRHTSGSGLGNYGIGLCSLPSFFPLCCQSETATSRPRLT
jgi:hypothetical protein